METGAPPCKIADGPAGPDLNEERTAFVNGVGPQAERNLSIMKVDSSR